MAHGIIGTRNTVLEHSFFVHEEMQWYHVARYHRHTLHATKGWRKAGTHKMITKIHPKYKVMGIRITQTFERKTPKNDFQRLQVRP